MLLGEAVAVLVAAYLAGSLSFAVIVSRAMGLSDPRSYGSGNPGATNVLRSGRRSAAALTLAGDALKGAIGTWLGAWAGAAGAGAALGVAPESLAALGALAAFIGHLFPVFFGFRGGKGVATFLGAMAALQPWAGLACGLAWLAIALATRYSSAASLGSALVAPVATWWLGLPPIAVASAAVMTALLFWRHRANIANLRAGRERRIGERAPGAS
ncbi:MAG TPA: glycerol-3-phosphate 1-O-acyltransferase PlsY [Burkholderiaceae bacterium]|nr:glycerol-3-phosphate 1-O-acyltransferase PlsY [Burkholderiaceae bacterium]